MNLTKIDWNIMDKVADLHNVPTGAVNIRLNGQAAIRRSTPNVCVTNSPETGGLVVEFRAGVQGEIAHVPVVLSEPGLKDAVHNTFIVGEGADATLIAGCGIHSGCHQESRHDGLHEIIVKKGGRLRYIEKHYGEGEEDSPRVLNPTAKIIIEENAHAELEMVQIEGVNSTKRVTEAQIAAKGSIKITERLLTTGKQEAFSEISIFMQGSDSSAQILSRGVAQDQSRQIFQAALVGQDECNGHLECDAIIMDQAYIQSIPEIRAEDARAVLTHEAAIGKIAGEQLLKLMSLGISESEAIEMIIQGFLR